MNYPTIHIEGAILSADILDCIERGELRGQKPADFGLEGAVKDEIASGAIMEIKVRGLKMTRSFYIISHKRRVLPAPYSTFLKFLTKYLKENLA